jgi:hypothetical protein
MSSLPIRIRKLPGLDLARDTGYPDVHRGFLQYPLVNIWVVTSNRLQVTISVILSKKCVCFATLFSDKNEYTVSFLLSSFMYNLFNNYFSICETVFYSLLVLQSFVGPWPLFQFLILYTVGTTPTQNKYY